jgi:LPXTG-motif cell wall-anchored protein
MLKHKVWEFGWSILLGIVVIVFCLAYLYVRRKKETKHVDQKAGDEGED